MGDDGGKVFEVFIGRALANFKSKEHGSVKLKKGDTVTVLGMSADGDKYFGEVMSLFILIIVMFNVTLFDGLFFLSLFVINCTYICRWVKIEDGFRACTCLRPAYQR